MWSRSLRDMLHATQIGLKTLGTMLQHRTQPYQRQLHETIHRGWQRLQSTTPYRKAKQLREEFLLQRLGIETLQLIGYYQEPKLVATVSLRELAKEKRFPLPPAYKLLHTDQKEAPQEIPSDSIYVVLAEYRYCIRLIVGAAERYTDLHGKTRLRGSAPLAEYVRPHQSNEWTQVTSHSPYIPEPALERHVFLLLEELPQPSIRYEPIPQTISHTAPSEQNQARYKEQTTTSQPDTETSPE